jgi:hypothetical protein
LALPRLKINKVKLKLDHLLIYAFELVVGTTVLIIVGGCAVLLVGITLLYGAVLDWMEATEPTL